MSLPQDGQHLVVYAVGRDRQLADFVEQVVQQICEGASQEVETATRPPR